MLCVVSMSVVYPDCLRFREFKMGAAIEDQQVSCLWQGDYLLSVSVSGHINYLDRNNPGVPHRILKVGSQGGVLVLPGGGGGGVWSSQGRGVGVTCSPCLLCVGPQQEHHFNGGLPEHQYSIHRLLHRQSQYPPCV